MKCVKLSWVRLVARRVVVVWDVLERDESDFRWQNLDYDDNLIQVISAKWNWFPGGTGSSAALAGLGPICSERGEKIG